MTTTAWNNVLVLGGSGFIGHHIVREMILAGKKVRVLARPHSDLSLLSGLDVEITIGDMENQRDLDAAMEGIDSVVHAAAYYPVYSYKPKAKRQRRHGMMQISRIHDAIAKNGVKRFVYITSPTSVGRYDDGRPEDENAPYPEERNKSTYALVKYSMQRLVLSQAKRFNTVLVAPTGVFGEGDRKPTTGRLVLDVAAGRLAVTLRGKMNIVNGSDVAKGVLLAMDKGRMGRIYVLGGQNISIHEMVGRCARIVGAKQPILSLPPKVMLPVAWLSEMAGDFLGQKTPLLPRVGIDFAINGEYMSSRVAEEELGYEPTKDIDETIKRTWEWFRKNEYYVKR